MIITLKYAKKLAKQGMAIIELDNTIKDSKGNRYIIVTRLDKQRIDHINIK